MKINIFFFISKFIYGGAGNAIFNFLKNLDRKKFKVHIIFLNNSDYQSSLPNHVKLIKLKNKIKIF